MGRHAPATAARPCDAFCLPEGVRQQVHIRTDPAAVEVAGLPLILILEFARRVAGGRLESPHGPTFK
jgi:hypothetical protein